MRMRNASICAYTKQSTAVVATENQFVDLSKSRLNLSVMGFMQSNCKINRTSKMKAKHFTFCFCWESRNAELKQNWSFNDNCSFAKLQFRNAILQTNAFTFKDLEIFIESLTYVPYHKSIVFWKFQLNSCVWFSFAMKLPTWRLADLHICSSFNWLSIYMAASVKIFRKQPNQFNKNAPNGSSFIFNYFLNEIFFSRTIHLCLFLFRTIQTVLEWPSVHFYLTFF